MTTDDMQPNTSMACEDGLDNLRRSERSLVGAITVRTSGDDVVARAQGEALTAIARRLGLLDEKEGV